jgi:hypothetical protein
MDSLKTLAEIWTPDSRQTSWVRLNSEDGSMRPLTLEDHYASVQQIIVNPLVPEDIRQHMETAKNLALYSWYVYRFIPVAELHAYAAFEWALRIRLNEPDDATPSFRRLLADAVKAGMLKTEDFKEFSEPDPFPIVTGNSLVDANLPPTIHASPEFLSVFQEAIVTLRNMLAHGSVSIWPSGIMTLSVIATAINALFQIRDSEVDHGELHS